METSLLRLVADDADGLRIIAAAVQDGIARRGDMKFDGRSRTFGVEMNRFQWERATKRPPYFRSRSVLAFAGVLAVRSHGLATDPEELVSLLDIEFRPDGTPPGGCVALLLAGGSEIRLDVECVDVTLLDTGAAWPTRRKPDHERPA